MSSATTNSLNQQTRAREDSQLASRVDRLIAAIIDGVIMMVATVPVILLLTFTAALGGQFFLTQILGMVAGVGIFVALNYKLLRDEGQTIGKRLMNVRIVGRDGNQMDVNDLLLKRYAPIWGAAMIPFIGGFICLANALLIFRDNQACGHDDIAQTKVVTAN